MIKTELCELDAQANWGAISFYGQKSEWIYHITQAESDEVLFVCRNQCFYLKNFK